jgi:phosphohistidine phosphatase SixA
MSQDDLQLPDDVEQVMVVGHCPTICRVKSSFTNSRMKNARVRAAGNFAKKSAAKSASNLSLSRRR